MQKINHGLTLDINDYNPHAMCVIHVDLNENKKPVDWTFVYCNEPLARLEGVAKEELIGKRFYDIFPDGDRKWLKPYYKAAYEGIPDEFDDVSEEIDQYLHVEVFPTGKDGYCACTLRDIKKDVFEKRERIKELENLGHKLEQEQKIRIAMSKYMDAERKNEQLRIDAERANQAKSNFLLRMSHDMRTPLNGVLGMIDIAEQCEDDKAKQRECREKAKMSAKVLLELINEVLDMGKLESGEISLEHIPFDIAEISRSVANVISRQLQGRNIKIIEEDCHIFHHKLVGSPVHFKRIMMNILSNAIKYNRENGKIYITCREVSNDGKIANIEFKCRDTGFGMTEEFKEHIFEPFSQENITARSQYGGTGLGMSIVKNITDMMGGTITVESTKGEGTTFDVLLPFEIDQSEPKGPVDNQKIMPSIKGYKLILAEDNVLNMEIARYLLEQEGAELIETVNGQEAVDAFAKSEPYEVDGILMDVMMPVMNGHEATIKIRSMDRADAKEVPIIAMTASAFAEDRIAAKKAGMTEHLAKPLDTKLMIETIAECVSEYRKNVKNK